MAPMRILFLCTANSCHSQMAEGWAHALLARNNCPIFPGARQIAHVGFPDPAYVTGSQEEKLAEFRCVRDMIRSFVAELPASITQASPREVNTR